MKIAYLDGARLRRALLAACENARGSRAELNRINVFPVPDGDTGTNLALTVSSRRSGRSCPRAGVPVQLVDSRGASLCQGLLVLKAAELAELAWDPADIAAELARVRDRSGILFTVDTLDRLLASGRVGRGRAWLGGLLDIKPILQLNAAGGAEAVSKVRGQKALLPKVLQLVARKIGQAQRFRFGVVHVDAPEVAEEVRGALLEQFGQRDVLVSPATPVIATHIGRGAWSVAYQVED